jgi:RNA polymerase sigma factor (sigma-70 family)
LKDEKTVEVLWRENHDRVVRTAYLLTGDVEDARELAQDAFVAAVARWGNRPVEEYAERWLIRIVRNQTISLFRRRSRERQHLERKEEQESIETSPEAIDPDLLRAIASLPPSQRSAFVCRYYLDCSVEETSRLLGKRPGTVRALAFQAASKLRQELLDGSHPVKGDERV